MKNKFKPTSLWYSPETDQLVLIGEIKRKWLGSLTLGVYEDGNWLILFKDQWFLIGDFS